MTARRVVTVTETIHVGRDPESVFDLTQDYAHRRDWDASITAVEPLDEAARRYRLTVAGIGSFTVAYRLFRRPERTSAAFVDPDSRWISGGGGSWEYVPRDGGTVWSQTNTLELRHPRLMALLAPMVERNLRAGMRRSMAAAKAVLESPSGRQGS